MKVETGKADGLYRYLVITGVRGNVLHPVNSGRKSPRVYHSTAEENRGP